MDREFTLEELAEYLKISRSVLYDYLLRKEYIYRNSNNLIIAYKEYTKGGYAYFKNVNRVVHGYPRYFTVVTEKGIKKFKKEIKEWKDNT